MPPFSSRVTSTGAGPVFRMTARARALRAEGHDVISLAIGEPDFATPPHAIEAAHQAALRGETKYPPVDGTPALKDAVIRMYERDHGLRFGRDEILVANGGKQIIFDALMATVEAGDEVVVPAPYWAAYPLMTQCVGGAPVFVRCGQNNGFRLRAEDLEGVITPATRWVTLNFPNNPSGAALSADELRDIGAVLLRHPHVWVLVDDMYGRLRYDGARPVTLVEVEPKLRERTLTLYGASKSYAMTGWRIGFGAGPAPLIRAMADMQGQATAGVSTIGQAAAAAALDGPQDGVRAAVEIYRQRRDLVVEALGGVPGVACHRPEGAFYVYPSVAGLLGRRTAGGRLLATDDDVAEALLEEQHVAAVAGSGFGMSPYLRLSYAADERSLARACERFRTFAQQLG